MWIRSPSLSAPRSPCYHSAVAIMFLLSLYTLKYLLPQCCFNMVFDCSCRPTSACQVYVYIHVSMTFITVSMYFEVTGATVPCQLVFFCSSTLRPCYHSHVSIRLITVHMHLQNIADTVMFRKSVLVLIYTSKALLPWNWRIYSYKNIIEDLAKQLSPTVRRWKKFAWCDSSWWQIRGISPGWRLFGDIDKFAKFLISSTNIYQVSPNVFLFRQTFSVLTLLSQYGVNDVFVTFFMLTSHCYHCVVSIRLFICSYPQVHATTLPSTHTSPL